MERTNRHWLYLVSAAVDMLIIVASFIGASYFYLAPSTASRSPSTTAGTA